MDQKNIKWYKVADNRNNLSWQKNGMMIAEAGRKKVTLVKTESEMFACAYKCPHAGGVLADGYVVASKSIVCPLHRYKFNLADGRNTSGEGYFLKVFPVEERPEGIFVGFEESSWLNFLK